MCVAKKKKDEAVFSADTVALIWERDEGRCAKCGDPISGERGRDWSVQHRKGRGMGGAKWDWVRGSAANGCLLHGSGTTLCHGYVTDHPDYGFDTGLAVSRHRDPCEIAVRHAVHGLVFLELDGSVTPAEGRTERQFFPF